MEIRPKHGCSSDFSRFSLIILRIVRLTENNASGVIYLSQLNAVRNKHLASQAGGIRRNICTFPCKVSSICVQFEPKLECFDSETSFCQISCMSVGQFASCCKLTGALFCYERVRTASLFKPSQSVVNAQAFLCLLSWQRKNQTDGNVTC
jgi:hypothetical protein